MPNFFGVGQASRLTKEKKRTENDISNHAINDVVINKKKTLHNFALFLAFFLQKTSRYFTIFACFFILG
jgi:hypothetical protein